MTQVSNLPDWFYSVAGFLSPQQLFWCVNAFFLLFSISCVWFVYYAASRALGFRKFRGTWYSSHQFNLILEKAYENWQVKAFMDDEERDLVERYILGRSGKRVRASMRHKLRY